MTRPIRLALLAFVLAAMVIVIDQWVKTWLVGPFHLAQISPVTLFGPIRLNLSFNDGVSFGFLRSEAPWTRWALSLFSGAVAVALAVWALRAERVITATAIGLVMGGAVGNMIDRITRGSVIDFIDASALHFPWVFNVADSAISVGVVLLLTENLLTPKPAA